MSSRTTLTTQIYVDWSAWKKEKGGKRIYYKK